MHLCIKHCVCRHAMHAKLLKAFNVQMRVLIDHSCVEIYLSTGEVLSTRVYRGQQPADSDAGIDFVAFGGTAKVEVTSQTQFCKMSLSACTLIAPWMRQDLHHCCG